MIFLEACPQVLRVLHHRCIEEFCNLDLSGRYPVQTCTGGRCFLFEDTSRWKRSRTRELLFYGVPLTKRASSVYLSFCIGRELVRIETFVGILFRRRGNAESSLLDVGMQRR